MKQNCKEMLKLVSAGAVIKTNTKLSDLKPGQTVMVLTVDNNSEAVKIGKRSIYMPLKNFETIFSHPSNIKILFIHSMDLTVKNSIT